MTYGSARHTDDVAAYLTRVRAGRAPEPRLLTEFQRRYALIGLSPLIAITQAQAACVQTVLGPGFRVVAGMRFSEPGIAQAVERLVAAGAQRILGVVLSPQYSPILMTDYQRALEAAAANVPSRTVRAWHREPAFVDVLASRIRRALASYPWSLRQKLPVLLTAHSLPRRVVDREGKYVEELAHTAASVAAAADLAPERWRFCFQSAGHTPEEWLKPDMLDLLPELAAAGHRHVLVAPVQFLADHLETLYDIDIAARERAKEVGFESFSRIAAPNASPDFAVALAGVVQRELAAWDARLPAPV